VDIDRRPLEEVLARLQAQPPPVIQEVVAGLDAWMLDRRREQRPEADWQRLVQLSNLLLDRGERGRELRLLLSSGQLRREIIVDGLSRILLPFAELCQPARERLRGLWRLHELAAELNPAQEPVLNVVTLAQALAEAGDGQAAERLLRSSLAARPDQVVLLKGMGRLLTEHRPTRLAEAIECYRAVRAVRPHMGIALAESLVQAGRPVEGEAILHELIRTQSDNAEVHFYLGTALYKQAKLVEAEAAYRKAIALRPDYAEAHNNLGTTRLTQNRPKEAEAAYRKAIALRPDYAEAYNNLGNALFDQKKVEAAVAAFGKAIALKPGYAAPHFNLGLSLRDQKRYAEAEVAFRKAIALRPEDADAHTLLGAVLHDQKRIGEAEASFRRATALKPDHARAVASLRMAERLVGLDQKLTAVLAGKDQPRDAQERVELAQFCASYRHRYVAAVALLDDAFVAAPKLAADLKESNRYNAACYAALAAAGKGQDAGKLDDMQRARLRQQALAWLHADLDAYTALAGKADGRQLARQKMTRWLKDDDLAGVRDRMALAALTAAERKQWSRLWGEVANLREKTRDR
jgi:tetratricopeptide (TPR) repeat protein